MRQTLGAFSFDRSGTRRSGGAGNDRSNLLAAADGNGVSRSRTLTFVREALTNYSQIRSPFPSSRYLARSMIDALGAIPSDRPIVELGPGTGALTGLLLSAFPRNPLYAVEWNPRFVELLAQKYPRVRVGHKCASLMGGYLREHGVGAGSVGGVLSGLPVTGFRKPLRNALFQAIAQALEPGGLYVQMTYHGFLWKHYHLPGLVRLPSRRVWRNVPPALVLIFRKSGSSTGPSRRQ